MSLFCSCRLYGLLLHFSQMNFGFKTTACSLRIGSVLIVGTSYRNTSEMKSDPGDQYFIDYFFFFFSKMKVIFIRRLVRAHSYRLWVMWSVWIGTRFRAWDCKNRAFCSGIFFSFFLEFPNTVCCNIICVIVALCLIMLPIRDLRRCSDPSSLHELEYWCWCIS